MAIPTGNKPRRDLQAVIGAGIVIGAVAVVLTAPGAPFGPPAPPKYGGGLTVVFINADVSVEQRNASGASLRADPAEFRHCANAYYWDNALHVYTGRWGRAYDPALRAMILFSYHDRGGFIIRYGFSEAFDLGAEGATIFAALNQSTALYTVRLGAKVEVTPQAAPRSIDGNLSVGYAVNGTNFDAAEGGRLGTFYVVEIHDISTRDNVPVYLQEATPCI